MNLTNLSNAELVQRAAIIAAKRKSLRATDEKLKAEHNQLVGILVSRKFDKLTTDTVKASLSHVTQDRLDNARAIQIITESGLEAPRQTVEFDKLSTSLLTPISFDVSLLEHK